MDYFIAEEHRVDIIKDVTTLQLSDLDPRDALHQILAQHNHRALVVTLELPISDMIPKAQANATPSRALIGTRVLDQMSGISRSAYVSFGNTEVLRLWQTVGRDNVKTHRLVDILRARAATSISYVIAIIRIS